MKRFDERERGFLLSLYELRYLGVRQIWETWYPEKSLGACGQRLRKLRRDGYLVSTRINNDRWQFAWRLGIEGFRSLRRMFDGDFEPYKPLAMIGLPHLLDTNEVYLMLSCGAQGWGGHFDWQGSHRCVLPYEARDGSRQLHPDAIVTPKAATSTRVLIELDRGTEAIRGEMQRATIERKIRRFVKAGPKVVREHFSDGRKMRLVFVVPAGATRRKASVLGVRDKVAKEGMGLGRMSIEVVTLDDVDGIRKACGVLAVSPPKLAIRTARPNQKTPKGVSGTELALFRELFGVAAQFNHRWQSRVEDGKLGPTRAHARFCAIKQQLVEVLGAPPLEPEDAAPAANAAKPQAAVEPVLLDRKRVANQVSPTELQVLLNFHGGLLQALRHAQLNDKRTASWGRAQANSLAVLQRVEHALGEHGEPQGFQDVELRSLFALYEWGLFGLMQFASGCTAYEELHAAVKPARKIVARLCPTETIEAPDPNKHSLQAKNAAKEKQRAEKKEQARRQKTEADAERQAREAEAAKKKGLGRLFGRG